MSSRTDTFWRLRVLTASCLVSTVIRDGVNSLVLESCCVPCVSDSSSVCGSLSRKTHHVVTPLSLDRCPREFVVPCPPFPVEALFSHKSVWFLSS